MSEPEYRQALPTGYGLESYMILDVLGVGGFGVTYLAQHARLGHKVALKEYLPNEIAVRDGTTVHPKSRPDEQRFLWGLERFLDEAKTLTRFRHPNLIRVTDYFEGNNTAYFVMDYEVGKPLNVLLAGRRLSEAQLRRVLWPILDALKTVHSAGVLHRDIKPANIFIRQHQESPVLIDFGSARNYVGQQTQNPTSLVSPGYSPWEQYFGTEGDQGPWTDIYSLAGVCYRAVTGKAPIDALQRMNGMQRDRVDPQPTLAGRHEAFSPALLSAIDAGLQLVGTDRPQTVGAWQRLLDGEPAAEPTAPATDVPPSTPAAPPRQAVAEVERPAEAAAPAPAAKPPARRRLALWSAAAAIPLAIAVAATLWFATSADPPQRLSITSVPADADISIVGVDRPYRQPGMDLESGNYEVVVAAPGYATHRETVSHGDAPTRRQIVLDALTAAFLIEPDPADADVSILSPPGTRYAPGTELPSGQYRIRVAADGFEPAEVDLMHGPEPTRHAVALAPSGQPFTIDPAPPGARVRVLNIKAPYEAEMMLAPGTYRVEVSASGFQTVVESIAHGTAPTRHAIALSRTAPSDTARPFTIATEPPGANVQLLDGTASYQPGMFLPTGDYRVQVSAPGHLTYRGTIRHDERTPLHRVRLRTSTSLVPEMVRIEAGSFTMGDRSGQYRRALPTRTVTVGAFAMGVHEVTYAEFDRFSAATGRQPAMRRTRDGYSVDAYPVTHVSWDDAVAYANWLSEETGRRYRLPTEAEWEYAARAGTDTRYSFGDDDHDICHWGNVADQAWADAAKRRNPNEDTRIAVACSDGEAGPAPAESYAANPFGVKNMHGNVWEWVADCYRDDYQGSPIDGTAWDSDGCPARVVRGRAANSPARHVRSAHREPQPPHQRLPSIGFRLAEDPNLD